MSLSVSGASATSQAGAASLAAKASAIASRMMKDLDADSDGKISKDEFVSGLQGKGVSAEAAGKMFDAIDKQKAGSIGKNDIEAAVKVGTLKPPPRAGKAGGTGGAGAAGGSSAKTYDKADLNQDGTVSESERMIYDMRQAAKAAQASEASKGTMVNEMA